MTGYPLDALETVRAVAVEERTLELRAAIAAESHARADLDRARQEKRTFDAETARLHEVFARGQADGMRATEWTAGARYLEARTTRAKELSAAIAALRRRVVDAARATEAARAALASSHADVELVERHRVRWDDARDDEVERKRADEADDVRSSRRE
jgi:hypothetical protein